MCSGGLEALVYRVNSYSHRRLGEKFQLRQDAQLRKLGAASQAFQ